MQASNPNNNNGDNPVVPPDIDWDRLFRDFTLPERDLLLSAAAKNKLDKVRDLIENQGVPPSHGNGIGQTALHLAVLWGHVDVVRYLIQAGANVDATNSLTGASPLHVALQSHKLTPSQSVELVQILLDTGGADPVLEDKFGKCAIEYVKDVEHPLHSRNSMAKEQYAILVQRLQPPPPGMDRIRANLLKQIQTDEPTCFVAK